MYASDFEVPQNRRRVIIIGIRKDLEIIPKEPDTIIKSVKNRIPVKTILVPKEEIDKMKYNKKMKNLNNKAARYEYEQKLYN